jgi:hypothetical protein
VTGGALTMDDLVMAHGGVYAIDLLGGTARTRCRAHRLDGTGDTLTAPTLAELDDRICVASHQRQDDPAARVTAVLTAIAQAAEPEFDVAAGLAEFTAWLRGERS